MLFLLDASVLTPLGDSNHTDAIAALRFFEEQAVRLGWATCPLVEDALLCITGHPRYPDGPGSTDEARRLLRSFPNAPG